MRTPEQFVELLRRYNHAYYNIGEPEVEDSVYDALKDEFLALFPGHPFLEQIGAPLDENSPFPKANHEIPMGSLNKATNEQEFRAFANKAALDGILTGSEKLDGLSLDVVYWNGHLRQGITRGDGRTGYDITRNLKRMKIPELLPVRMNLSLRAEIFMKKSDFAAHFAEVAKNPRNAAVGLTKRLDGVGCEHLSVYFYDIIADGLNFKRHFEKLNYIENVLRLPTPFYKKVTVEEACQLQDDYELTRRAQLDYEIDGLVFAVDDISRQEFLGDTDFTPKYSIAYKFVSQSKTSTVLSVRRQVGRTGKITPVAEIEPVEIAGATITNVTLHNYAEIERLGLRIGSSVEVKRSGDVIPKITQVLNPGVGTVTPVPTHCPACNTKAVFNGIEARCVNDSCPAKVTKALIHWLTTLEVMHFGEKLVEQLEEHGFLNDVSDFYNLKPEDIANIEGRGFTIAQKVLGELEEKRTMSLGQLLAALSIPGLSDKTGKLLASEFGTLDKIMALTEQDLLPVAGIAEISAKSIVSGLQMKKEVIEKLRPLIRLKEVEKVSNDLAGKTFCFTGVRPDKSLEEKIEANGGKIASGVSKKLSFLVTNEANATSTKANKARELGIPVISLFDLEAMVN